MTPNESEEFTRILTKLAGMFGRNITADTVGIFWSILECYELADIKTAIHMHLRDGESGKFFPMPAHLIAHLQSHDGRPSADEAWAEVPKSEAEMAYWTAETSAAFWPVLPLLEVGDVTAARMAFRAGYDRLVNEARQRNIPVSRCLSEGTDKNQTWKTMQSAVSNYKISLERAQELFPQLDFQPPPPKPNPLLGNQKLLADMEDK